MTTYLGIDPGKLGAAVLLSETGRLVSYTPLVYTEGEDVPNVGHLSRWLHEALELDCRGPEVMAALEKVNSFGMGRQSAFVFGAGWGALQAWLALKGIPFRLVTPQAWQKKILEGLPRENGSVLYCQRRWPDINLFPGRCTKAKDGPADAACIAEYVRTATVCALNPRDQRAGASPAPPASRC